MGSDVGTNMLRTKVRVAVLNQLTVGLDPAALLETLSYCTDDELARVSPLITDAHLASLSDAELFAVAEGRPWAMRQLEAAVGLHP